MHRLELGKPEFGSNVLVNLPGDCIQRPLNRFFQFDLSHIGIVKVLGAVFDLLIVYKCAGIISFLKGRCIHNKRLDRTAGLSVALESAVQSETRVNVLGSSSDHCHYLACVIVNTDCRTLHFILAVICCVRKFRQFLVDVILQILLHIQVKSRVDLITALVEFGEAGIVELIIYLLIRLALLIAGKIIAESKIRIFDLHEDFCGAFISIREYICILIEVRFSVAGQIQHDLLFYSIVMLLLRDHSVFQHIFEDQVSSLNRMLGINQRIIISRTVGDRAQVGDLGQIQLIRCFVKISFTCGSDPIIPVHEINIIQIEFHDLVLGILFLKVPGDKDLLHFALPGPSVVQKDTSGELHGDRTAALRDLPLCQRRLYGAGYGFIVDTAMFVEILVLDTDHCAFEHIGDLIESQVIGILFRQCFRDQTAVCGVDLTRLRRNECFLRGLAHKPIRLVLHCFYFAVVSAEIKHAQPCQYSCEYEQ